MYEKHNLPALWIFKITTTENPMRVPANSCPTTQENENRTSIFVFRFHKTSENGIRTSISDFRFPMTSENGIRTSIFDFRFPTTLENEIRTFIFVFHFSLANTVKRC